MHLEIKQPIGSLESVSSAVIDKLYNLAFTDVDRNIISPLDQTSVVWGNITAETAYEDAVTYLKDRFRQKDAASVVYNIASNQNQTYGLTIDVNPNNYYIRFADNAVKNVLMRNGIGDEIGITKSQAALRTRFGTSAQDSTSWFLGNTSITSFDELSLFGITQLTSHDFRDCTNLRSIDLSNITSIGQWAFRNTALPIELNVPNLTGKIGRGAFAGSGITKIENLGSCTGFMSATDDGVFKNCSSLTSVNLPNSVTELGIGAFANCSNITTFDFDFSDVNVLGDYAFANCSKLKLGVVNLPNITSACKRPFGGTEVQLLYLPHLTSGYDGYYSNFLSYMGMFCPQNADSSKAINILYLRDVNNFYDGDFVNCIINKLIIDKVSPPTLESSNVFAKVSPFDTGQTYGSIREVYVPDAAVNTYKGTSGWSDASAIIKPMSELTFKTKEEFDAISDDPEDPTYDPNKWDYVISTYSTSVS